MGVVNVYRLPGRPGSRGLGRLDDGLLATVGDRGGHNGNAMRAHPEQSEQSEQRWAWTVHGSKVTGQATGRKKPRDKYNRGGATMRYDGVEYVLLCTAYTVYVDGSRNGNVDRQGGGEDAQRR